MSGISFKIAAPARSSAPPSRPASRNQQQQRQQATADDSDSDDDDFTTTKRRREQDELVTGFDSKGASMKHREVKQAPLVIPSLPNKDWRQAAQQAGAARNGAGRKKREMYIPDAVGGMRAAGVVGDGSQGGLGTTDVINSTPVVGGLAVTAAREDRFAVEGEDIVMQEEEEEEQQEVTVTSTAPETDEQRALRELMSGGDGSATDPTPSISTIQSAADSRNVLGEGEPTDTSASSFQQDVHSRPDEATLSDYARVPVGEFGAAMLRGMGWKPGQAASRTERGKKGPVEAFVPTARPSLLGIGAKAMSEVLPQEKGKGVKKTSRREEMRFVPLLKKEREGSASASAGGGIGRSTPAITGAPSPSAGGSTRPALGMSSRLPSASPPPHSSSSRQNRPVAADSYSSSRDDRDRDRDYRRSRDNDDDRRRRDRDREGDSSSRRERDREGSYRSSSKRERDGGREGYSGGSSRRRSRSPAPRERGERRRSRSPPPSRRDDRERRRDDDRR